MKQLIVTVTALCLAFFLTACVSFPPKPPSLVSPKLSDEGILVRDGSQLATTVWGAPHPIAIIIAVHGMNDYASAFDLAGAWWSENSDITVISYDQRGFGRSLKKGIWPGAETLRSDLADVVSATQQHYGDLPVFILGHSMGGAVALSSIPEDTIDIDGLILAAPAVWGGAQMPILYRLAVNIAATFSPGKFLTGERAARQATDNIEILREMHADPLVIKQTRIKSILGITRLMGDAWQASRSAGGKILFIYGDKDEIIPLKTMQKASDRLCGNVQTIHYENGWHLLFRDHQRHVVFADVANWIRDAVGAVGRKPDRGTVGSAALLCASMAVQ